MRRAGVVLADTDETIIAPLEIKFLEGMGEDIDLRVITDTGYFRDCFSRPQDADILVIGEDLYYPELQKQNFRNIFVLAEKMTEELSERGVIYIFKYASIKEIYSRVIAEGGLEKRDKARNTQVVLVCSASGGVGKTTLALGMSAYFARHYQRTIYINAERINDFHYHMSDRSSIPSSVCQRITGDKGDIYAHAKEVVRNEGFDYLPPFAKALSSMGLDLSIYRQFIAGARMSNDYDVIIVDTDSIFDREKAELVALADKVILLWRNTGSSIFSMNTLIKNMDCSDEEKYYFICNGCDEEGDGDFFGKLACEPAFTVSERMTSIENIDSMGLQEIAEHEQIQKIAALIF